MPDGEGFYGPGSPGFQGYGTVEHPLTPIRLDRARGARIRQLPDGGRVSDAVYVADSRAFHPYGAYSA